MDIVILGAGIAGLCVGYQLAKKGLSCLILEKDKEPGGLAKTHKFHGVIFDLGPHFIFGDRCPEAVGLLKSILKGQFYEIPQQISYYCSGRYFPFPPHIKHLSQYPPKTILHHLFRPFLSRNADHKSFEEELIAQHGRYLYEKFFSPYLYKKLGGRSGQEVHKDWWLRPYRTFCTDSKTALHEKGVISSFALIARKILFGSRQILYYPYNGFEDIVAGLKKEFLEKGGIIKTGVNNIRLESTGGNVIKNLIVDNEIVPLKGLVSTAPIHFLAKLLGIRCPDDLNYTDIIVCFVTLRRKVRSRNELYIYYADYDIIFNRIYFPLNIDEALAPAGKDGLCIEIARNIRGDKLPSSLRKKITEDLAKVNLCQEDDIEEMKFEVIKNAIPTYPINYEELLNDFLLKIDAYKNVWLAGRTGAFYNVLTDGVIKSALEVAGDIQRKIKGPVSK